MPATDATRVNGQTDHLPAAATTTTVPADRPLPPSSPTDTTSSEPSRNAANSRAPVRPAASSRPRSLRDRDETDARRQAVELVQRGRMILDISIADLEAAEALHGAFHPVTWYFRNACNEARRAWDRLRAELGTRTLENALVEAPLVVMTLGADRGVATRNAESPCRAQCTSLIVIGGKTYCVQRVAGSELAPVQWRLTRPNPPLENGPYYACRLADGRTQCDCAEWTYQIAEDADCRKVYCKHLAALAGLGWI